jgi:uncharacterized membrane protein
MNFETLLSVATLGSFIWAVRFLVPKAIKADDGLAITCAALTAVVALLLWLLIGVGTRSSGDRNTIGARTVLLIPPAADP